jgi:SNF2 family DNA or RNA helicase
MKFTPAPYQLQVSEFLQNRSRAAAFVGVGLGKTASTLHALRELILCGEIRRALVVAPLRVARLTWPNEIRKWENFRGLRVQEFRGARSPDTKAHVCLTNYEQIQNIQSLKTFDVVVFDELTRAKNPRSSRIKAIRNLLKHSPGCRRWGLTGTPRPNSLLELFAQIRLLDDGVRLGENFEAFKRRYFHPTDYMEYNWEPIKGSEELIYAAIADVTLTLRSQDYLDIPDTEVEDVEITLSTASMKRYAEMEKSYLTRIQDSDVVAMNSATVVNKLLQLTGGFAYTEDRQVVQLHAEKIAALQDLLTRKKIAHALIATNYVHERQAILKQVSGAVDASTFKGNLEDAWNSGSIRHLVADPRSLGHGLNLQGGGSTVVWYSPCWSRELYDQFNGRVARRGQTETPKIYRLLCSDTIDLAVVETLRERGNEQAQMLQILLNLQQLKNAPKQTEI